MVDGQLSGLHRSPHSGFSVEFQEHREYTPGEDLRHLDWKVFGRTDKYYLKRYENETSLICHLIVDVSESMAYRSSKTPLCKHEYACSIAAALAWLMLQKRNAVSLTTFDSETRASIPLSSEPQQLSRILNALDTTAPSEKTELQRVLMETADRIQQRGIVIVISDFFADPPLLMEGLKRLVQHQHDVVAMHVIDRAEIDFPFTSPTRFSGLEQLPREIVDPMALGRAYRCSMQTYLEKMRRQCADLQVQYERCCTDEELGNRLARFLRERHQ